MSYPNTAHQKKILDEFCRRRKCKSCPLIMTDYCQLGDKRPNAIKAAFDVYIKGVPLSARKKIRGKQK